MKDDASSANASRSGASPSGAGPDVQGAFDFPVESDAAALRQIDFTPTRQAGLERLTAFAPSAGGAYASKRNFDLGSDDRHNISCLSPWIRRRAVLEEEVVRTVLARHAPHKAEKFLQEVFWRGYFKGWLEHHPGAWSAYVEDLAKLERTLGEDDALRRRYDKATDGRTGLDGFDAWTRELCESGYVHNHARMWFASIWIFTLNLPWQLGADFFLRHLVDADPASNTLSWRWVAGLHTVGKTYLARPDNIEKYTNGRFKPAALASRAEALFEAARPEKRPLRMLDGPHFSGRAGLLLTEDDCCLDDALADAMARAPGDETELVAIAGIAPERSGAQDARRGAAQTVFARGVIKDAAERGADRHKVSTEIIADDDIAEGVAAWARAHNLDNVIAPFAPVGPSRSAARKAKRALDAAGIRYIDIQRSYDALVWPHASKGFFNLKKQIPTFLNEITRTTAD